MVGFQIEIFTLLVNFEEVFRKPAIPTRYLFNRTLLHTTVCSEYVQHSRITQRFLVKQNFSGFGRTSLYALCLFLTAGQHVLGHFCPVKKRGMRFVLFWKKTLRHLCYPSNAVFALFFADKCHSQILDYYSLHSI